MTNPGTVSRETSQEPSTEDAAVRDALCARYPDAADGLCRYAALLTDAGVTRGLIGPREVGRLWSRHLANSAVLDELVAPEVRVVDIGSGAGLPGLPLALVRPDLTVVLVEPLLRRAVFLAEVLQQLGLAGRVELIRDRAEQLVGAGAILGDVVTARAVAPLERLAGWTLPLVPVGGELLALKGSAAAQEAQTAALAVTRLGGGRPQVVQCGHGLVDPPTTVVRVHKVHAGAGRGRSRR